MASHAVETVETFEGLLQEMLDKARVAKQTDTIEPTVSRSDIAEFLPRVEHIEHLSKALEVNKSFRYAVIETAVRRVFNDLLASSKIDQPEFVNIWDLLDIVSILSDDELCDPALGFWLVEELLDSQTIAGCRKVFDYLESRRERMTAKHFKQKELVILRSCKELLRRLSRAEDTAFCGRVYVFMFQSFPLGDKSSVNLRGEYHVENVTTFDLLPPNKKDAEDAMDVDNDTSPAPVMSSIEPRTAPAGHSGPLKPGEETRNAPKSVTFDAKDSSQAQKLLDPDTLYPVFWSLQQNFSQPKRLFQQSHLSLFKEGLEATIAMFKSVQSENSGRGPSKSVDEGKRGIKRKRGERGDNIASTFNPKYLTSRDLFELEISDLSFRRHILVQALIIMDFLLSLSAKAKEKLATVKAQNKSVMYQEQILSEEDTKWAIDTKKSIADYLKQGFEGPFFYRMVETVLSRDKNWVRWKIESCPSIERPAITPEEHHKAKAVTRKFTANKRIRNRPIGSLDLGFLAEGNSGKGMEKLKDTSRYETPSLDSFKNKIALDEMEIEMPTNDETKDAAVNGKASKSWRALRVASKTKLVTFDKIEDSERIDIIFRDDPPEAETTKEEAHDSVDAEELSLPDDRRPVVISGLSNESKSTAMRLLINKHPKVFTKIATHTTRTPHEGENSGVHHFIDANKYDMMRDGDQFLEISTVNGHDYGTSRKSVEAVIGGGKIPILDLDHEGVQQLKDQNYSARFAYLVQSLVTGEPNLSELEGFYDKVIVNEIPAKTCEELGEFIFGRDIGNGSDEVMREDEMAELVDEETRYLNGTVDKTVADETSKIAVSNIDER